MVLYASWHRMVLLIGEMIHDARISAGLTQMQLARLVGVTNVTVSYWENNHRMPTVGSLLLVAEACGMQLLFRKNS